MAKHRRPKRKAVFKIQLTTGAKQDLEATTDRIGITQIALTSKLVEWFALQPGLIQSAILGLYPDIVGQDVAQVIIERMERGEG